MDKNYFIMLVDTPWAGPTANLKSGPDFFVNDGLFIKESTQLYEFNLEVDSGADDVNNFPPCDIYGPTKHLLFSSKLIEILSEQNVDNIQYFDSKVIYSPTQTAVEYNVANIIGVISGLNMEKSELMLSPMGNVMFIDKMVFDEEKMKEHKVFRLKEKPTLLIVHKSIKEAIETASLKGIMFVSDDEYDASMI